ncbi:MAG: response regulator [Deltaproteobacteria bacterium]|nr:response regulator [Deltaproteobacteria bacterium]
MMTTDTNDLEGLKVLVVDDEPDARTFISTVLEDHGAITECASDGFEALEKVRAATYDLMTLDLGMPGKNGVEVYHELRQDPELHDLPVCIITGRPELRKLIYERSTAPAPEGYLDKPVDERTLIKNIRKIIELGRRKEDRDHAVTV